MDIKLKNKYIYIVIVIIGSYMLALSLIAGGDFVRNREYLEPDYYFKSTSFTEVLYNYYNAEVRLQGEFKNYSQKAEEDKVNDRELQNIKNRYYVYMNNELLNIEKEHINKFYYEQDNEVVKKLTEEKNKKIDEIKSKYNSITDEDYKKLVINQKEKEYKTNKDFVEKVGDLKYYFTDIKTKKTYTNIVEINGEDYIEKSALCKIKFPLKKYYKCHSLDAVDSYLEERSLEGYVIVPYDGDKNAKINKDYKYFNSIRNRIIKEGAIFVFSFIIGLFILIYVKTETDVKISLGEKIIKLYNYIPLIIRFLIFISSICVFLPYEAKIIFFYKPLGINQFIKLTITAIFVFYFMLNIKGILKLKKNKGEIKKQWHSSLLYRFPSVIKGSLLYKDVIRKIIIIFLTTVLLGICIGLQFSNVGNRRMYLMYLLYIVFYLIFVGFYVLRKITYFNKIVKTTEEIVAGNLNCEIIEEGKGTFSKLAFNVNNMKIGYKKSLEEQIKSERLKSELITNVSHDLKTPLTSIINYINLLKKRDLSKEEIEGYIGVLDKKSQRLKVIIEDLFEASKMASGAVELNVEKVDVAALLKQAMGEFDEKIKKSSLIFKVNISKQNIYANLDGKKTWRVFENLIGNALKYSQPNTRVYIDLLEEENKIKVIIKNIASYEMDFNMDEIFERFKRGDKSRNTEGSGLGLAIAKSIMELQGGRLGIEIDGDLFKAIVEIDKNYVVE